MSCFEVGRQIGSPARLSQHFPVLLGKRPGSHDCVRLASLSCVRRHTSPRLLDCHDNSDRLSGTDRRNSVPSEPLRSSHNRPPSASTIDPVWSKN
jgi:hypothetical protein